MDITHWLSQPSQPISGHCIPQNSLLVLHQVSRLEPSDQATH